MALLGSYWVFPGPPHPRSISVCHRFSQVIGSAAHRACNTAWICFRTFHTLCPFKMGSLVGYPVSHQRGTQQPVVEVTSNISVLCLPGGVGWGTAAGSHVQKKTFQHSPGPWNHQSCSSPWTSQGVNSQLHGTCFASAPKAPATSCSPNPMSIVPSE